MKNVIRKMTALLLIMAMCGSLCIGLNVNAQEVDEEELSQKMEVSDQSEQMMNANVTASDLKNPIIEPDDSMEAGQKVTWDCIWFGSYPQAEVVPSEENYNAVSKDILKDGDIIVDNALYNTLQNANEWDDNNDTMINGNRYRRIKEGDATFAISGHSKYYNWSDLSTWHYFKYVPIKWRVLKINGNQALLLSDMALDDQKYHPGYEDVTWETSTIRSWLNGYSATSNRSGTDYNRKNFISSAFTSEEQSAIVDSSVVNTDNIQYGTTGGNDTTDKIFLLTESEVYGESALSYGFVSDLDTYDEARRCKSSTYAKAMGISSTTDDDYKGNCTWWLRSPGFESDYTALVSNDGIVANYGINSYYYFVGVRAALNLNLSSNQWSYAGTVCSNETVNEEGDNDHNNDITSVINLQDSNGKILKDGDKQYTELQYLSFAKLAYNNIKKSNKGDTINELVSKSKEYDERIWKTSPIILRNFYQSFIGDWEIVDCENDNNNTGFVAITFKKGDNVIISYCGSQGMELQVDWWNGDVAIGVDWNTDLQFAFWNTLSKQFDLATNYYKNTIKKYPNANITFTGHSLGGALATYESILTGKKAYTFDSAGGYIIDLAYMYDIENIRNFIGIDKNNFINYTDKTGYTIADAIQHTYQEAYNIVEYDTGEDEVFEDNGKIGEKNFSKMGIKGGYSHKIWSCLSPIGNTAIRFNDSSNSIPKRAWSHDINENFFSNNIYKEYFKIVMAGGLPQYVGSTLAKNWMFRKGRVMLGTSENDTINAPNQWLVDNMFKVNTNMLAGNGYDQLNGYSGNDILRSGKNGNKWLDGSSGNDWYIIEDNPEASIYIYDSLGSNTISFEGMGKVTKNDIEIINSSTIKVGNNQIITLIRLNTWLSKMKVKLSDGTYNWEDLINNSRARSIKSVEDTERNTVQMIELDGVGAMVILDPQGNVIQTISNELGTQKNVYKDYGHFYAFNDEEGQKLIAYILDDYSVRIQGNSTVDFGAALISQEGLEEIDIAKEIDINSCDIVQQTKDNQLIISQQTEDGDSVLNGITKIIPVQKIDSSDIQIKVGESKQIQTTITPSNATDQNVSYEIEDSTIAEIDNNGKITAKHQGETMMTIVSTDGYNATSNINIKVTEATTEKPQSSTKISKITLSGISKKIATGKKVTLTAKITPSNATNKALTWKSSNKKVATVSSKGVVTMKKNSGGKKVTITATAKDGSKKKATYKITSMKGVIKKLRLSGKKSIKAGKSLKLEAYAKFSKGANKTLNWTSSNKKYATVNSKGVVKTYKKGKGKTVKITAMATDGSNKKASIKIKIK